MMIRGELLGATLAVCTPSGYDHESFLLGTVRSVAPLARGDWTPVMSRLAATRMAYEPKITRLVDRCVRILRSVRTIAT